MSFISDTRMVVRDLDALEQAAPALGFELVRDVLTYKAHERGQVCAHVLRLKDKQPGDYEVGVIARGDGTFGLSYDTWGAGERITRAVGRDAARLKQEYTATTIAEKAKRTLAPKGFTLQRELLENGTVRLRLRQR